MPFNATNFLAPYDCPARGPGRILVIDDDEAVRLTLQRYLQTAGFEVLTASSGPEGLQILRHGERFRAVLLDLMMPGMDGWRFRREQLGDPALATVPVIILTGAPLGQLVHEQLQAADYILKPVGREHLISVVSNFCEPARTAA